MANSCEYLIQNYYPKIKHSIFDLINYVIMTMIMISYSKNVNTIRKNSIYLDKHWDSEIVGQNSFKRF